MARDYPDRVIIVKNMEANVTSTVATESALTRVLDEAETRVYFILRLRDNRIVMYCNVV